jgi:hypothetical protein
MKMIPPAMAICSHCCRSFIDGGVCGLKPKNIQSAIPMTVMNLGKRFLLMMERIEVKRQKAIILDRYSVRNYVLRSCRFKAMMFLDRLLCAPMLDISFIEMW